MIEVRDSTISLYKLEQALHAKLRPFVSNWLSEESNSFRIHNTTNDKYVKPNFTEIEGEFKGKVLPNIFLISAAGATGKSELTRYMSSTLSIPVFDLAIHTPVASNSLTGLFFENLGADGLAKFVSGLRNGSNCMIIDALDEGYLKTTLDGFNSFLDEIVKLASGSEGIPFIILGRTQVVEYSWIYFDEKGIKSSLLKLEPFTVEQAKEFIDKQIGETRFSHQYQVVRDFIVNSVEGFFKSDTDIKKGGYNSFIGYAPVLLSISSLLRTSNNYIALEQQLRRDNSKGVELILSIVEYIVKREKEEKIDKIHLPRLLIGRSQEFNDFIYQNAYTGVEQCIRILYFVLGRPFSYKVCDDALLQTAYEEKLNEWVKEHPFLEGNTIQNAVFECYIVSILLQKEEFISIVIEYLNTKYRDSFVLFFLYSHVSRSRKVHPKFLRYIYSSLKSLDVRGASSQVEIEEILEESSSIIKCEIEFFDSNKEFLRSYEFEVNENEYLDLGSSLSNTFVNAPINLQFGGKRCEFLTPVFISCNSIRINCPEFIVESMHIQSEAIIFECNNMEIDYEGGNNPKFVNRLSDGCFFQVSSSNTPDFPFIEYFENLSVPNIKDNEFEAKYLKLRKIIMQFRSHSKGGMAKLKDKIHHRRVIGTDGIGQKVLESLIATNVLTWDQVLYYINDKKIHEILGVSYLDFKKKIINEKTIEFLKNIN